MAGRGVDALANRAGKLALNDGPTLLGEGAFGKVYKEMMPVAVKKIENFDKEKAVKEVEILMSLNHKNIIKCYGHHYEDNGRILCITMEFADKGTFTKVITEAAQDPGSVWFKEYNIWRTLSHLSDALDYLHTLPQPILHRDLKPDNILGVTRPENGFVRWKLADFGLVKLLDDNAQGDFYAQTECGTPTYMAPEVCCYLPIDQLYFHLHRCGLTTRVTPSQQTSGPWAASWHFVAIEGSTSFKSQCRI